MTNAHSVGVEVTAGPGTLVLVEDNPPLDRREQFTHNTGTKRKKESKSFLKRLD